MRYRTPAGLVVSCRPGTTDETVVREQWLENVYRIRDDTFTGGSGVVLDIGANIGAFSLYAIERGARHVIAYEPEAGNFAQLERNCDQAWPVATVGKVRGIEPQRKAITATGEPVLIEGTGGGAHIGLTGAVAESITLARAVEYSGVAAFDMLKMDVEGAEYDIMEATPDGIIKACRYIAIETHTTDSTTWGRLVARLAETHRVEAMGGPKVFGGYVYALRYGA